jgi:hypothetical protein
MPLLALEEYADIAAELDAGAPREETLAAMNVPLATYLETQQHWLARMAIELQRGRSTTFDSYNARFLASRRAVAQRIQASDRAAMHARRVQALGSDLAGLSMQELPQRSAEVAADAARLTLTQYASLCAELAVQPEQDAAIRARYGFDTASFERERAQWDARFAGDRALFDQYLAYFRHYRDWLAASRAAAG